MKLLNDVLQDCGFDKNQQTTIVNLIQQTAVSDIPEFRYHTSALIWLVEITQKHWLRGEGLERWDVEDNDKQLAERDTIMRMFQSLGLIDDIKPKYRDYDYVLMMGALESRVETRLDYAHFLYAQAEYNFDHLVMLSGARPLMADKEPSIKHLSPEKQTEHGMMMYLLDRMKDKNPDDSFFSKPIQEIDTPMQVDVTGKSRRPNTKDTIDSWLATKPKPGRALVISNQPYCSYQHSVARVLLPPEFDVETIGHHSNGQDPVKVYLDSLARLFYTMKPTLEKQYKQGAVIEATTENKPGITSSILTWCCSYGGLATLGALATAIVATYYSASSDALVQLGRSGFGFFGGHHTANAAGEDLVGQLTGSTNP